MEEFRQNREMALHQQSPRQQGQLPTYESRTFGTQPAQHIHFRAEEPAQGAREPAVTRRLPPLGQNSRLDPNRMEHVEHMVSLTGVAIACHLCCGHSFHSPLLLRALGR